jgi:hypothetical protein
MSGGFDRRPVPWAIGQVSILVQLERGVPSRWYDGLYFNAREHIPTTLLHENFFILKIPD